MGVVTKRVTPHTYLEVRLVSGQIPQDPLVVTNVLLRLVGDGNK